MRVLLLAQACNPEATSEPSVHYNVARAIADRVDVVVATSIRHKRVLTAKGVGRAEIVYIDTEYILEPLCRIANLVQFTRPPRPRSAFRGILPLIGRSVSTSRKICAWADSISCIVCALSAAQYPAPWQSGARSRS